MERYKINRIVTRKY